MRYFTKEEIDALRIAEQHFNTAVHMDYKLATPSSMNKLVEETYKAAGGSIHFNWTCARCAYAAYKTVGKWYFESIENLPKEEPIKKKKARNGKEKDRDGTTVGKEECR